MPQITTFLSFRDEAEEAMNHYLSVFQTPASRVVSVSRYGDAGPGPPGSVMVCAFELDGHPFAALNGGPGLTCSFSPAVSLVVNCDTQEEVDHYWEGLSAGGEHGQCGWLKDKFGVSWQVCRTRRCDAPVHHRTWASSLGPMHACCAVHGPHPSRA
jgi:predicted 3-demethylubiquinone-9 3-methyltransferase (glyoxalase superfamily)